MMKSLLLLVVSVLTSSSYVHAMRPARFDEEYTFTAPTGVTLVSTNDEGGGLSTQGVTTVFGADGGTLYEMPVFTGRRKIDLSPNGSVIVLDGNIYYGSNIMRPGDGVVTQVYLEGELWKDVRYITDLDGEPIDSGRIRGGGWATRPFTMEVDWERNVLTYDMGDSVKREIALPNDNPNTGTAPLNKE